MPKGGMRMVTITGVEKGSRAARHGVQAGDILISINGREIRDVLDYRFYLAEEHISIKLEREGKEIEVGDYIHVTYNGQMTFSIPAQIAAQKIGCYAHTGVVGEITEGQFALETEMEMILVNATAEQIEGIEAGMTVTVYSNGAMTMSLPAQIGAEFITVTETITD